MIDRAPENRGRSCEGLALRRLPCQYAVRYRRQPPFGRAARIWPLPNADKALACASLDGHSSFYCNHCNMHLQVLTLENYDNVQFQLADDTNFGALIFILAWVVFGYYVLLVLFMAIILEAFESKYDKGAIQDAYLACEFTTLHVCCSILYAALHCMHCSVAKL